MLVDRAHRRLIVTLSGTSALLAAASAALTLGHIRIYEGVLPAELLLGTLGFDVVSLLAGVALGACLFGLHRRHERYWLVWIGLQGFLLYTYATYAFGFVFTPLYFAYVAILGLSAYALMVFARAVNVGALGALRARRLPRRTLAIVLVLVATTFGLTWTAMLLGAIAEQVSLPAATVIVLDLAFALPLLAVVGALLFFRRPTGDLLAPGVFALSAMITLGVAAGEFMKPAFGLPVDLSAAAPYLLPAGVCGVLALLAFRRVGESIPRATA